MSSGLVKKDDRNGTARDNFLTLKPLNVKSEVKHVWDCSNETDCIILSNDLGQSISQFSRENS